MTKKKDKINSNITEAFDTLENIPKCKFCSNTLEGGTVENFYVVWTSTIQGPCVLVSGDICTPCCEEKKKRG